MIIVNDLKPGTTFIYEGDVYQCIDLSLNKTAMRKMVVKAKSKNLHTGTIIDCVFNGGEKVEPAHIDKKAMNYLYQDGDNLVFMDNETYDQIEIPSSRLTWELNFLKANDTINIEMYNGEILGIILPDKMNLKVTECEPAVKGDTATSAQKNATLETGWTLKVPLFIKEGEMITISTIDGKYSSRAKEE